MILIILAFYMVYTIKDYAVKLLAIEGGFSAFSTLNWVEFVIMIICVPLSIFCAVRGVGELREGAEQRKREEAEAEAQRKKQSLELFDITDDEDLLIDEFLDQLDEDDDSDIFDI